MNSANDQNRRSSTRYTVDGNAQVSLLNSGAVLQCTLVDLCLGGCCLRTQKPVPQGINVLMELVLKVRGTSLRLNGVTQWTDKKYLFGVRFVDMNSRRAEYLRMLIDDLEYDLQQKIAAQNAAEDAKSLPLITKPDLELAESDPDLAQPNPEPEMQEPPAIAQDAITEPEILLPSSQLPTSIRSTADTPPPVSNQETSQPRPYRLRQQRTHQRYEVDTTSVVHLVNLGIKLHGSIQNLSPGGCRIRTNERFTVGIYVRAEIDFYLKGLPFRLPGVTQAIHDKFSIGIRFLDMSDRKREQLNLLMEELKEMAESEKESSAPSGNEEDDLRRAS